MVLRQCFLTENNCYMAGKLLKPKGIMVHSTGANNPYLKRYVGPDDGFLGVNKNGNHWNRPMPDGRSVCVHAFIGKLEDGSIATYQTLPFDMRGWHAGGLANDTHIGFEICEDNLTDGEYFNAVYKEAVELCVMLCKKFSLSSDDIICHSEGHKKGIASNHSDVMHWFPKHGKTMDDFRAEVKKALESEKEDKEMEELKKELETVKSELETVKSELSLIGLELGNITTIYNKADDIPDWARPTIEKLIGKGYIKGDEDGNLGLDMNMVRLLVINDRAGLYKE